MKIAILGYAGQGQSACEYWDQPENELTICDRKDSLELPPGVSTQLGEDYLQQLDRFDLLVRTPALHPREIVSANPDAPNILEKVTTNTNEFFRVCPSKNIIGVTGTKGKGTTSTLIAKILEATGKKVHLGGNIGIPPLDLLKNDISQEDYVVLELANFQLIDLKYSPHIAVTLMVEPEHLDWHEDLEEYIAAKQQLFIHQQPDDITIYYAKNENSISIADASGGIQIPFMEEPGALVQNDTVMIDGQTICGVHELKLLGRHNWQNVCAAVTASWQVTQDISAIRGVLTTFAGLPFRIEFRTEKGGLRYYNDSFASAPDATIAALHSIPGKKVMIIGGHDRQLPLDGFARHLKANDSELRSILVIGASGDRLVEEFRKAGLNNYTRSHAKTMTDVVQEASHLAKPGDAIVLSPGFPSFDMFDNFEDRGLQFNAAVEKL